MNNEELPDYKQTFLNEMNQLREQQYREQHPEEFNIIAAEQQQKYLSDYLDDLPQKITL